MFRAQTAPKFPGLQLLPLLPLLLVSGACSNGSSSALEGGASTPPGPSVSALALAFEMRLDQGLGQSVGGEFLDLDLDGDLDLVSLDPAGARARVALGQADGSFVVVSELDAPQAPVAVAVADLDGDGLLDLALACGSPLLPAQAGAPFSLAIWFQQAGGVFDAAPSDQIALPEAPIDLCPRPTPIGTELAVVLPYSSRLQRFALAGTVLQQVGELQLDADLLLSVAALDLGADGAFDLVLGELSELILLADDGLGALVSPVTLVDGLAGVIAIESADLDGDGRDELVAAELFASRAQLLDHDASGLVPLGPIQLEGGVVALMLEDLDGDGLVDLCAAIDNYTGIEILPGDYSALEILPGDGALGFGDSRLYEGGGGIRALGAQLLPGDDYASIYSLHADDVALMRATSDGDHRAMHGMPLGELPYFLVCADLDKDGRTDALSVDVLQRSIVFLQGRANGGFEKVGEVALVPAADAIPTSLVLRDFDGDGFLDLAVPVHQSGEVVLMRNQGSLPFAAPAPADRHPAGPLPLGLDAGDLNGDGFEDLIVASSGDRRLRFLAGAADGEFVLAGELDLPARPVAVCARDLDLDGDLDIVVSTGEADGTDTRLLVIEGDGSLSPSLVLDAPLAGVAPFLDAGDLDGDGRPEIVVSQTGLSHDELILARSTSGLDFVLSGVSVGKGPGYVSLRDVDEDGALELLVALAQGELVLLEDDGAGGLAPVAGAANGGRFPLPVGASAAELCEATGDELLDLLAVSPDSAFLWIATSESVALPQP